MNALCWPPWLCLTALCAQLYETPINTPAIFVWGEKDPGKRYTIKLSGCFIDPIQISHPGGACPCPSFPVRISFGLFVRLCTAEDGHPESCIQYRNTHAHMLSEQRSLLVCSSFNAADAPVWLVFNAGHVVPRLGTNEVQQIRSFLGSIIESKL